jgi:hypothetical protein
MTNLSTVTRVLVAAASLWPAGVMAQPAVTVTPAQAAERARLTAAERAKLPAPHGFSVVLVLGEMQGTGAAENVPPAARKALVDMKDFLPYKSYRLLDAQWTLCCGRSMIATRLRGPEEQDYDLELEPRGSETSGKWNMRFSLREAIAPAGRGSSISGNNPPAADRTANLAAQRAELETKLRSLKERYNENHPEVLQLKAQLDALSRQESIRTDATMKRYRVTVAGGRRALIDTSFTMDIGETVVVGTSRLQGDKALIALLTAVASPKTATR